MDFETYQEEAHELAVEGTPRFYPILGLVGEAGEVAEVLKKNIRDNGGQVDSVFLSTLQLELGDVLWYLSETANRYGISLEAVAATNLQKLRSRRKRGTLQGSGNDR